MSLNGAEMGGHLYRYMEVPPNTQPRMGLKEGLQRKTLGVMLVWWAFFNACLEPPQPRARRTCGRRSCLQRVLDWARLEPNTGLKRGPALRKTHYSCSLDLVWFGELFFNASLEPQPRARRMARLAEDAPARNALAHNAFLGAHFFG